MKLIRNRDCAPLVRLVAIVAYYEACESPIPDTHVSVVYNLSLQLTIRTRTRSVVRSLTSNFRKIQLTMRKNASVTFWPNPSIEMVPEWLLS